VTGVFFRPKATFRSINEQNRGVWRLPMLILTLATLASILVAGSIKQQIALNSTPELPPDFQYFSPEQQAQVMQAMQATSGPVFIYVFPAIVALLGIWLGWLLVGGLLHLAVTLFGGRGETIYTMNLVAWASLPLVLRELVRAVSMLVTGQLINSPGLSGFAPADPTGSTTYLSAILAAIDIYLLWHIVLLVIGVRVGNGLSLVKSIIAVLLTVGIVTGLAALLETLAGRLGSLTIIRPFF
jgi:hypothetical protein